MSDTSLVITCRTWIRDSKLLFDYKSRDYWQENIEMTTGGCLALTTNMQPGSPESFQVNSIVLKINKLGDDYIITPTKNHPLGEVISKTKRNLNNGTLLKEDDIFKIGRLFYKVKELNSNTIKNEATDLFETNLHDEKSCRICFSGSESPTNPLVSLCSCTGSMKYTHLTCLQKWILSKAKCTN